MPLARKGHAFSEKVPRKSHPVGQEYKTIAGCRTCCIIRLDVSSDTVPQEFDDQYSMKTIATVSRLTKPCFYSGRTVVADSWFGSPAMVRKLKNHGLYSIMQVKKRRYWPRGMPERDVLQELGPAFGDFVCMKSTDDVFVTALRDRQPAVVISNCGITTRSNRDTTRFLYSVGFSNMKRPQIFEEYEDNKGMFLYFDAKTTGLICNEFTVLLIQPMIVVII